MARAVRDGGEGWGPKDGDGGWGGARGGQGPESQAHDGPCHSCQASPRLTVIGCIGDTITRSLPGASVPVHAGPQAALSDASIGLCKLDNP